MDIRCCLCQMDYIKLLKDVKTMCRRTQFFGCNREDKEGGDEGDCGAEFQRRV